MKGSMIGLAGVALLLAVGCASEAASRQQGANALSTSKDLDAFMVDLGLGTPTGSEVPGPNGLLVRTFQRDDGVVSKLYWRPRKDDSSKERVDRIEARSGADDPITLDGVVLDAAYTFGLKNL